MRPLPVRNLCDAVRRNCEISDARHSTIYSLCNLVLKLRNLYKWEHELHPWQEPEPKEILAWIDEKENGWKLAGDHEFLPLPVNGRKVEPFAVPEVNPALEALGLYYGAGYGRAMKPVFFLAEKLRTETVAGFPVYILGPELARELSSPFAMAQDGLILIRREALRFFLCDLIREMSGAGRNALHRGLSLYGMAGVDGKLQPERLPELLDAVVDGEMEAIIHHEVGELLKSPVDREIMQKVALFFAGSVVEFVSRGIQDILADTDDAGMLGYILRERKETSLCFYVVYADGLRQLLFPEIGEAVHRFLSDGDWEMVARAVAAGRRRNLERAGMIREVCRGLGRENREQVAAILEKKILTPLGLSFPPAPSGSTE